MVQSLDRLKKTYAELLVHSGVNLQPGQCLRISSEIAHRGFTRMVVAAAYGAGAKYVQVDWTDTPTAKQRFLYCRDEYLDYYPGYEIGKHEYMIDQKWARIALVGPEYPEVFEDVEPAAMRRTSVARSKNLKFFMDWMMANGAQWCVAGVPTRAWAKQVFPELTVADALERMWRTVLHACRVDTPDPHTAWLEHDRILKRVVDYLNGKQVRSLLFIDAETDGDGQALTNLTVGMTDKPVWLGASSETPEGTLFFANMPTEEVFSTPHNQRTEGYVRISKPAFPFDREVRDAFFRFEGGEVVEYSAAKGKEVLDELFEIEGARRLGEVALVDISSPINQSGLTFYEILYDENATCHIAFGNAYPDGLEDGSSMSTDELSRAGANQSPTHVDVMIGSPTMNVDAQCADGSTVSIMKNGRFVDLDAVPTANEAAELPDAKDSAVTTDEQQSGENDG